MKGFIDHDQQDRLREHIEILYEDLERIPLRSDRKFIEWIRTRFDDRKRTVAEADRIGTIAAQHEAIINKQKE
ncbi:MAG: hypothetical protein JXM79_00355 [Sedimentisphaerales bacterium]|nr:hypothetical protein [Sedimentisphaerales bacterium]